MTLCLTNTLTKTKELFSPADAQRSILDSFGFLEDWAERYQYLSPFPETKRIEANRLHGCQAGGSA